MKIVNGKIAECTESELYGYYLDRELDECYDFPSFMNACIRAGTVIVPE